MAKLVFSLLTTLVFALRASSLSIIIPLYTYPGDKAAAWKPVTDAIKANPFVQFQVIVNPSKGPGADHYPDPSYIAGLRLLNSLPNAKTLGYVDTVYAKRPIEKVNADIDKYANWASFKGGNIAVQGIFFDEVSTTASQDVLHYMERASDYTRTHDHDIPAVVCNPGAVASAKLYAYCDTVIEFEDTFTKYQDTFSYNELPGSSKLRGQSAIITKSTPSTTDVKGLVSKMGSEGIGALYFSGDASYKIPSATLLQKMVDAVAPQRSRIQGRPGPGPGELR